METPLIWVFVCLYFRGNTKLWSGNTAKKSYLSMSNCQSKCHPVPCCHRAVPISWLFFDNVACDNKSIIYVTLYWKHFRSLRNYTVINNANSLCHVVTSYRIEQPREWRSETLCWGRYRENRSFTFKLNWSLRACASNIASQCSRSVLRRPKFVCSAAVTVKQQKNDDYHREESRSRFGFSKPNAVAGVLFGTALIASKMKGSTFGYWLTLL